jgi:hypothetical protein
MFGESTGPVDIVASYAPLGDNRKCTEQGVPAQTTGCSSAVRLAVRSKANLVGRHARILQTCREIFPFPQVCVRPPTDGKHFTTILNSKSRMIPHSCSACHMERDSLYLRRWAEAGMLFAGIPTTELCEICSRRPVARGAAARHPSWLFAIVDAASCRS